MVNLPYQMCLFSYNSSLVVRWHAHHVVDYVQKYDNN